MQLVFVLEGIVADRAGGDERGGAGAVDEFRVLAAQFSSLLVKSLLRQRTAAADALLLVHKPVFLPHGVENLLHCGADGWGELGHTAAEVGHTPDGVERLDLLQVLIVSVGVKVALVAGNTADGHQVYVHRTVLGAAAAHQAVLASLHNVLVMFEVAQVAQQIDRLHIHNAEVLVERAAVDAHTATRAGAELEFGEPRHLDALLDAQFAEIDEEDFREDVHIARERQQQEENAEGDGETRKASQGTARRSG